MQHNPPAERFWQGPLSDVGAWLVSPCPISYKTVFNVMESRRRQHYPSDRAVTTSPCTGKRALPRGVRTCSCKQSCIQERLPHCRTARFLRPSHSVREPLAHGLRPKSSKGGFLGQTATIDLFLMLPNFWNEGLLSHGRPLIVTGFRPRTQFRWDRGKIIVRYQTQ